MEGGENMQSHSVRWTIIHRKGHVDAKGAMHVRVVTPTWPVLNFEMVGAAAAGSNCSAVLSHPCRLSSFSALAEPGATTLVVCPSDAIPTDGFSDHALKCL